MRRVTKFGRVFFMEDLPSEEHDFWAIYEQGWEDDTHHTLDELLKRYSDTNNSYPSFIDVGAWVGPISLWMSDRCPKIVAVEPDPTALLWLRQNVINNNADNILVEASAFGDGNEVVLGVKDTGWFGDSMTSSIYSGSSTSVVVPSLTFAQLVDKYELDPYNILIKMDIEGGEAEALISNLPFLKEYKPKIHLSFHGPLFEDSSDYLEKMGYIFSEMGDTRQVPEGFESLVL